jgi:two-component system KDP operon response regulator KdpE
VTEGPLLLVVEDEPQMRKFLRASLRANGYRLVEAETGEEGLRHAAAYNPDIVLLDLGLPDLDGQRVVERLREWSGVPIVVVSARGREEDKVAALDAGADDYLTKPFSAGELLARLRVALRHRDHVRAAPDAIVVNGDLKVDLVKRLVFVRDREIRLTPTEYKLLGVLVKNIGKVLTHRAILAEVWGPSYAGQTQYLRVYMGQLRQKLEDDPSKPRFLLTEPGVGYRMRELAVP